MPILIILSIPIVLVCNLHFGGGSFVFKIVWITKKKIEIEIEIKL